MIKLPRIALPRIEFPKIGPFRSWELPEKEVFPQQELDGVVVKPLKPWDSSLVFKVKKVEWVMCCPNCAREKRKTPLQWNEEELCFVCPTHGKFGDAPVLLPMLK